MSYRLKASRTHRREVEVDGSAALAFQFRRALLDRAGIEYRSFGPDEMATGTYLLGYLDPDDGSSIVLTYTEVEP